MQDLLIAYAFRFTAYAFFGIVLEVVFSVVGIEIMLGSQIPNRRLPRKHLEGFVSLYMIPIHGLGILFGGEIIFPYIEHLFILWRYLIWACLFTFAEVAWGYACDKILGFYSWDYYAISKYRMFDKGYTLWTLVPMWGIAGLMVEQYMKLLLFLSPYVIEFIKS